MSGIAMVNEIPAVMEEATMADAPGEIYEPVQTLQINKAPRESWHVWEIITEDGTKHEIDEFYCNVPTYSAYNETFSADILAVGRLTIAGGVAYVDVG